MKNPCIGVMLLLAVCAAAYGADAPQGLQARDLNGDGSIDAYYEATQDLTWLADANYWATLNPTDLNPYAGPGSTSNPAAGGDNHPNFTLFGEAGWRIPRAMASVECAQAARESGGAAQCGDLGDPAVSEMAHLGMVTLGNTRTSDPLNTGPFINYQPGVGFTAGYWTEVIPTPGYLPVTYYIHADLRGNQFIGQEGFAGFLWFVHDGDIGAPIETPPAIPEPGTCALFGIGVALLATRRIIAPSRR